MDKDSFATVNQQGFVISTDKSDGNDNSYTVHFSRINYMRYDTECNNLVVFLIGGGDFDICDLPEDDYMSISYAYRTWSARL